METLEPTQWCQETIDKILEQQAQIIEMHKIIIDMLSNPRVVVKNKK